MSISKTTVIYLMLFVSLLTACKQSKNREDQDSTSPAEQTTMSDNGQDTEKTVDALVDEGFILQAGGKQVIREDQLSDATPEMILSSIQSLRTDPEHKMTVFYLKTAGCALDNDEDARAFINEYLTTGDEVFADMDRMVKFLVMQDRPTIKKALLNLTEQLSSDQCLQYLRVASYITGTDELTFDPNALKQIPLFYKMALLDKLRGEDGEAGAVFDQMARNLNLQPS